MGLEQIVGPNIAGAGGSGAWIPYTPSIGAASGTFTSVSATGRYQLIGKVIFVQINIAITTNGTAAGTVTSTLPFTANVISALYGRETSNGKQLQAQISAGTAACFIVNYDNTYPGSSGANMVVEGCYESV